MKGQNYRNGQISGRQGRKDSRRRKKQGGGIGGVFRIVIIVILSLILVVQCAHIAMELRENSSVYHADEKDYLRDVTYENYYRILSNAVEDCEIGREYTEKEREIRALGFYYEAATLCRAYEAAGDDAAAAGQRERLERYRAEAGSYASETEKIDEKVGMS